MTDQTRLGEGMSERPAWYHEPKNHPLQTARRQRQNAALFGAADTTDAVDTRAAAFIAHSREDVPYLLDLVDSLTADLAALRAVVEEARGAITEKALADALQWAWDEWVGDVNAVPRCFKIHGPRTTWMSADFTREPNFTNAVLNELNVAAILDRGMKGENND